MRRGVAHAARYTVDDPDRDRVDLLSRSPRTTERALRPDRAAPPADLHRTRVAIVRQRVQVPSRSLSHHRHQHSFGQRCDLADRVDPPRVQLLRGLRPDAPEPVDRQRVQEVELTRGRHDDQPVGLADRARDLGQELGASDADRDRESDPFPNHAAQLARDLHRRTRHLPQPADVEERFVDGDAFDERSRVLEHVEDGPARFLVRADPGRNDDRVRAQPSCQSAAHGTAHATRPRLVARAHHHAAADDHRPPAQARIVPLLDRCEEGIEIGVQDVRLGHEHMFAPRPSGRNLSTRRAAGRPASRAAIPGVHVGDRVVDRGPVPGVGIAPVLDVETAFSSSSPEHDTPTSSAT